MASNEGVENRPFPYLTVDADLLSNLRQSAAEGLFHSFDLLVGKDAREAGIKFEVLLGVYTNAIQYVRFLETALAVSCVNTEFKDLSRMTDGKIQFRISVPTIAHGDGRRPSKQRTFIVVKNCHKHHISTEMELSMLDLEILHSIPETPVEYAEYVGAVKTVASALQFGVDALERGLINTVLSVKLRHAPPMFILQTLADPTFTERGFSKTVKSDLIAMFKRHLLEHSFFLDRAENMGSGFSQYVRSRLSEMVAAVSGESVLKGVSTYTTAKGGEPVGGVFIVTDNVLRQLLTFLGEEADNQIMGPSSYASFVVRARASTPNCRAEATVLTAPTYSAYSTGVSGILCRISRSSMDSSISVLMWCLWQFLTTAKYGPLPTLTTLPTSRCPGSSHTPTARVP